MGCIDIKIRCSYCGKEFLRKDWQVKKCLKRGQTKAYCSHACHNKARMLPICKNQKTVLRLFREYKPLIMKIMNSWIKKLSDKQYSDRIESKAYLAVAQFPKTKGFLVPKKDREKVLSAFVSTACKHSFLDVLKEKKKYVSLDMEYYYGMDGQKYYKKYIDND